MAAGHGAIYVSMGSAARFSKQELHSIAGCLAALPSPVLWKLAPVEMPGECHSLHEAVSRVPLLLMWLLVGLVATIVVAIAAWPSMLLYGDSKQPAAF